MYGHHTHRACIKRARLPILLVVSWAEEIDISLSPFATDNLVSRDGFGRHVPRQPAHSRHLRLNLVLTYGIPPEFRGGVYLFGPPIAIGLVPSLSDHAIAYRWHSLPRVRRHRASSPQGSLSNGCCLFRYHHGPINVRLSFSHTHRYWYEVCRAKYVVVILIY